MSYSEDIDFIRGKLSRAALFEQMAEEASELAQAAQKMARKLRGENPTPKTMPELWDNFREELADVEVCKAVLRVAADHEVMLRKAERWAQRLEEGDAP